MELRNETIEERLMEALTRAMLAEKVADKALSIALEAMKTAQSATATSITAGSLATEPDTDPFASLDDLDGGGTGTPVKLSPFTLSASMHQTVKQASKKIEEGFDNEPTGETEQ